jgi:hypothetical protein
MDVKISDRMANINPSAIREMLKVTAMPNVISFAAGGPSPEEFPVKELAHLAAEIFETDSYTALQYSVTEGYAPLREITKDRIKNKFNIGREFDDLIIVSGGQQTISLATQCLVNEGDISAKVWRYTGEKWSRQSEELPLHRVLDLAILVCRAKQHFREAYRYEKLYDTAKPTIDRIGLQGDAMTVEVCTDNEKIDEDIKLFNQALSKDDELIGERLQTLARILREMGY